MDYSSITFGLDVLVSVIFGAGGALAVWFKMKGKQDILEINYINFESKYLSDVQKLQKEIEVLNCDRKEAYAIIHERIGGLKSEVEENRKNSDKGHQEITSNMNAMELRIIKAIHEIKK